MVRAVHGNGRTQEETHTKRKSSGPLFVVPGLPCADKAAASTVAVGTSAAAVGTSLAAVGTGKFGQASNGGDVPSTASSAASTAQLGKFVGRSTGSGQCVALARAVQPNLGPTSSWRAGEKVEGNTTLQPGTVIATFNGANRYANATDGSSHAAVYLGQNAKGVQVLDQWVGKGAAVRTIPWHNHGSVAANTGAAFHVVKTG